MHFAFILNNALSKFGIKMIHCLFSNQGMSVTMNIWFGCQLTQPVYPATISRREELIHQAGRWEDRRTLVLMTHLNSGVISRSLYAGQRGSRWYGEQEVADNWTSRHQRRSEEGCHTPPPWSVDSHQHRSGPDVTANSWQDNYFVLSFKL